ncbi:hypothetical protein JUJ52_02805 [Virgibacillus sp. AGTR]|uniref:hypothetical protein n=1 Tax=Virgibacillus sp. AGTR TaxID=2812055 RepID=UPI001D16CC0A|nr:hypothetical protein [Virgibacillus sp. AGTR]MCC2248887.1 hypothetical protein [Virgibacillus sp. AGTR]
MKKRTITFFLAALLIIGAIVPLSVSAASTWNYGYNKSTMQNYNEYYHSSLRHSNSMTKNDVMYFSPVASGGYWAKLYLDYTGPYRVTYAKYDL